MQKNLFILVGLLLCTLPLCAQTYERSIGFGYESTPNLIRPMSGGRWLIAGRGNTAPGSLFTDTLFVMVLSPTGQTLMEKRIQTAFEEVHYIVDAVAFPDGGVAVTTATTECDVSGDFDRITVINADGTDRWSKSLVDPGNDDFIPGNMAVSPDGNLIGVTHCSVVKYSALDGALLWQVPLSSLGGCDPYDFNLVPGTEDFLITKFHEVTRCHNIGTPASPFYIIFNTWNFPGTYLYKMYPGANGRVYLPNFYSTGNIKVFSIDLAGPVDSFSMPFSKWRGLYPVADGFYWLLYANGHTNVLKTNFSMQPTDTSSIANPNLEGYAVAAHGDTIAIAGYDYYGPAGIGPYELFKQSRCWFHIHWGAGTPTSHIVNAGAVLVDQTAPVYVNSMGTPPYQYFSITGGHYKIQVRNNGNTVLDQFSLNTRFDYFGDICSDAPAISHFYSNLGMLPGETRWFELDGLSMEQMSVPVQVCFWTSSPNGIPDYNHADDIACADLLVGTNEPNISQLDPYPNPADAGFTLEFPGGVALSSDYRVFDCMGRLVKTGKFADPQEQQYISTAALPEGVYWLKTGAFVAKVVVQRGH